MEMVNTRTVVGVVSTPITAAGSSPINDWIEDHGTLSSIMLDNGAATLLVETYPTFILSRVGRQ